MAFGEHRGNHWLLIPAIGIAIMIAAGYNVLPNWIGSQERLLGVGAGLTFVGIVCAGLFGHIIWLVPLALLLVSPLMLLFWMQDKYIDWRRRSRVVDSEQAMSKTRKIDEPKNARPSRNDSD